MTEPLENNEGGVLAQMASDLLLNPEKYGPDARLLGRAIKHGWVSPWKIRPEFKATIVERLEAAIESCTDPRAMSAMSETARRMASDDAKALIELVKLFRLVHGDSTENVAHDVRTRVVVERSTPERQLHDPAENQEGPHGKPAGAD